MKRKLILLAFVATASTFAGPREDEREAALRRLRGVPPPELAAVAAQIVASATPENRGALATAVLEAVSQKTPSSAPAVRTALINAGVLPSNVNVPPPAPPRAVDLNTPNGNSRFPTAPPHGGNPPGHNGQPGRKGPPPFVDYTKPRSF
jgi:hypothetical protein